MRPISRVLSIASAATLAAALTACGTPMSPYGTSSSPSAYPTTSSYPYGTTPVAAVEYGRITNVELVNPGAMGNSGNPGGVGAGTVIGGLVGGVLGNQVGGGSGRVAATVLGAVGGAVVGNQVDRNRNNNTASSGAVYRITLQTDQGYTRSYDVGGTDLRPGERVRIENGQIYRI